jgi:hypothetical protein
MRILVLGPGDPILTCDRIGIHAARRLEGTHEGVDVAVRPQGIRRCWIS